MDSKCSHPDNVIYNAAATALRIIRQQLRLPRHEFLSKVIDCLIPFIGSGNITHHRLECWFFRIMYISAFFIVSVFVGNLMDSIVQVHTRKFSTFDELAEINPQIYINLELDPYSDSIEEILR